MTSAARVVVSETGGRHVARLAEGIAGNESVEVNWLPTGVVRGVLFVRLSVGKRQVIRRVLW